MTGTFCPAVEFCPGASLCYARPSTRFCGPISRYCCRFDGPRKVRHGLCVMPVLTTFPAESPQVEPLFTRTVNHVGKGYLRRIAR